MGMLSSPGLDGMTGGELKYPTDCYSPKFGDTYRGKLSAYTYSLADISILNCFDIDNYQIYIICDRFCNVFYKHESVPKFL